MSGSMTDEQLLDQTTGLEHDIAKVLVGYNAVFSNRAGLDACKSIAALLTKPAEVHAPGCRCTDSQRDPMCDDAALCKDEHCPVGATAVGWPHTMDIEGCSGAQTTDALAYEFNNLLTVINGYATLLLDQLPGEGSLHRHAEEIKRASDRVNGVSRRLRRFIAPPLSDAAQRERDRVIAFLNRRCDYGPPCGKCAYCRIALTLASPNWIARTSPSLDVGAEGLLRSLIPRLCDFCKEGKRPLQKWGQRKNSTLAFTHFTGFEHVACDASALHNWLDARATVAEDALAADEFTVLLDAFRHAWETDGEVDEALEAIKSYLRSSFFGLESGTATELAPLGMTTESTSGENGSTGGH